MERCLGKLSLGPSGPVQQTLAGWLIAARRCVQPHSPTAARTATRTKRHLSRSPSPPHRRFRWPCSSLWSMTSSSEVQGAFTTPQLGRLGRGREILNRCMVGRSCDVSLPLFWWIVVSPPPSPLPVRPRTHFYCCNVALKAREKESQCETCGRASTK